MSTTGLRAPERFSTARLEASRIRPTDEPFLAAMFSDPEVAKTLGGTRDRASMRSLLDRWTQHWDGHGFGTWILRDAERGEAVGWVMLTATETGGPGVEVGWSIAPTSWRQGLATEAGEAAVRIAFTDVGLDALVSFTLPHNVGSRGVMEKLGFRYDTDVEHAGLPHVLYRLDRQTWENERG